MAPEKPVKKEKKEKKAKRSETDGVTKPTSKKDKKEKKEKEQKKLQKKLTESRDVDEKLQAAAGATTDTTMAKEDHSDTELPSVEKTAAETIAAELVPFAIPLANDKQTKKALKCVRTAAKVKTLKRGVKEVVKTLRKSAVAGPTNTAFCGVVIIAGDISPMDVISHLPVLCEDHNVPYIFVTSRAELGAAGATKRPTSVVMVCEKRSGGGGRNKDKGKEEEKATEAGLEDFAPVYKELVSMVQKATLKQVKL